MNAKNVTPDENAPEELVVPEETPVVVREVDDTAGLTSDSADDTFLEPVVDPVAESAVDPMVEPVVVPVATTTDEAHIEHAETVQPESAHAEALHAESTHAEAVHPEAVHPNATGEVVGSPVQTVYLTAPNPPRAKGNRGIGTLLAFAATIVFALVYLAVAAILILFIDPSAVAGALGTFVVNPLFYVPVLVFLVMMVLWAILANRASWWSWVIGSLVIAAVTYFASIGVLLLLSGGFSLTASEGAAIFAELAVNPVIIAAALVAREAAIWFGAAIAKRGRKVRERNYAAWQAFEQEETQKRAEFGGVAAV